MPPTKRLLPEGGELLIDGISGLYEWGELCEFTIKTSDAIHKVHRLVLSLQSSVLVKACSDNGRFLESSEAMIELSEDDSDCVAAMIQYFYKYDYCLPKEDPQEFETEFQVQMAIIADKYVVKVGGYDADSDSELPHSASSC